MTINGTGYTGYAYKKGETTPHEIRGNITEGQEIYYYVYQSKMTDGAPDGYFTEDDNGNKTFTVPSRTQVKHNGKSWGDHVTNNTDVEQVITDWQNDATDAGRTATQYRISVTGQVNATIVIDNLWSSYQMKNESRETGGISFYPKTSGSRLTLETKGDNRFGNIFYCSESGGENCTLTFDGDDNSSLTVANLKGNDAYNHFNAAIGASDHPQDAKGLVFKSGTIFAGTTAADDCTAIGGGGNGYGDITINGGRITAVVTSSGAAIGGGIGKSSNGGAAKIVITGGNVYAYNNSCTDGGYSKKEVKYIPAAAIGGGSSAQAICNICTVNITGGYVYAQSVGGTAIGGGSSSDNYGGSAEITIGGNAKVIAKSIAGDIGGQSVPAGAAIGGGTGHANGGNVDLTISGSAVVTTGSIGGGKTTSDSGKIGSATVKIEGGTLSGQIVMASGSSGKCSFTMTGGKIDNSRHDSTEFVFLQENGGVVWMNDKNGVAEISGGEIINCKAPRGGAVYMTGGIFNMSGNGKITSCDATSEGGAVYMGGGIFNMSGGSVLSCNAQNGGGIYLASGDVIVSGGEMQENKATTNGGAIFISDGTYNMFGGKLTANSAGGDGGAVYIKRGEAADKSIVIRSGEISGNAAGRSGGAMGVCGENGVDFIVEIGCNSEHNSNSQHKKPNKTDEYENCPKIENNTAAKQGGGIYFTGSNGAVINIMYCLVESGNKATDDSRSNFMMVDGGTLNIGSSDNDNKGNIVINDTIYVTGGDVVVSGESNNPMFNGAVTVDVDGSDASFKDNRKHDGANNQQAYTIQYFENFTENGKTSGQYTMYDVKANEQHIVEASMYSHPGYEIQYWKLMKKTENSYSEETDDNKIITYTAGQVINAVTRNYIFYAQWNPVGYSIIFMPGCDDYSGSMQQQDFKYSESRALTANAFIREGYNFKEWKDQDSGITYTDKQVVSRLSATNGAVITLVAQWELCDHNGKTYTVTVAEDKHSATCTCQCRGYSETVTVKDINVTYDEQSHPLVPEYKYVSLNGQWPTNPTWQGLEVVTYCGQDNDGKSVSATPENAGNYSGSISVADSDTLTASIKIKRAPNPNVPAAPTYTVTKDESNNNNIIRVENPNDTKQDFQLEYLFSWYENSDLKTSAGENGEWAKPNAEQYPSKNLNVAYTTYFVEVRYAQTCNYEASASVRALSPLVWKGNVTFIFTAKAGLSLNANMNEDEGIIVTLTPAEGYYIHNITHNESAEPSTYTQMPIITDSEKNDNKWEIKITSIKSYETNVTITVHFSGAAKKAVVDSSVARGEVFGDMPSETDVKISRDSAFTAYFKVDNFEHYTDPSVNFGTSLPKGTAVIMLDRKNNAYYGCVVESETNSIKLTDFTRMGTSDKKFALDDSKSFELQFAVDFSRCETPTSRNSIDVSFDATPEQAGNNTVPQIPDNKKTITLCEKPTFEITKDTESASINYKFAYMQDNNIGASKWDSRRGILVLSLQDGSSLPADARLKVTVGDDTVIYLPRENKFIAALPSGENAAKLELMSDMLSNTEMTIKFNAELCFSETSVGITPKETAVTSRNITINFSVSAKAEYAVKGSIEKMPVRGENLNLSGKVIGNLPGDYKVKYTLYSKQPNGYASTTQSGELTVTNNNEFSYNISLSSLQGKGNLSMMIELEIVDNQNAVFDKMPIYFILVDASE